MTTIAYRDGVMAGDARICAGDMVVTNEHRKVHKLSDGSLVGWCGGVEEAEMLLSALKKKQALPKLQDTSAILVKPDGSLYLFEGNLFTKQKRQPYYALGSGSPYALAAMEAGADAKTATRIATKFDVSSGGRVQTVSLKGKRGK